VRDIPAVTVVHNVGWPEWVEAVTSLKVMWRDSRFIGIFDQSAAELASPLQEALHGFDDFLFAPVRSVELRARVDRLCDFASRVAQSDLDAFKSRHQLESLLGESEIFVRALRRIPLLAAVDSVVLISGETGSGKELVARALHYGGPRRSAPFVPCNCGAVPDHLFENELFGHASGAYTDARADQKGLLAIANGGTLFLDEVDSLSSSGQVKLLRLLQDREYRPLGSAQTCQADVRIVAATNANLTELVKQKRFREDLFHRLNVLQLNLPPLRERASDIVGLAQTFLRRFGAQLGRPMLRISSDAFLALKSYLWPGNVRELESVIQRAAILTESSLIEAADLALPGTDGRPNPVAGFEQAKKQAIDGFERDYLKQVLEEVEGNVSRAARQAGKDRRTFQRLIRKYNLSIADYQS